MFVHCFFLLLLFLYAITTVMQALLPPAGDINSLQVKNSTKKLKLSSKLLCLYKTVCLEKNREHINTLTTKKKTKKTNQSQVVIQEAN